MHVQGCERLSLVWEGELGQQAWSLPCQEAHDVDELGAVAAD